DRWRAQGGGQWQAVGENILYCNTCATPSAQARQFHERWMQSPGHRRNIMRADFEEFGFGMASAGGKIYAVQNFLTQRQPAAPGRLTSISSKSAQRFCAGQCVKKEAFPAKVGSDFAQRNAEEKIELFCNSETSGTALLCSADLLQLNLALFGPHRNLEVIGLDHIKNFARAKCDDI